MTSSSPTPPRISVIVCSYKRHDLVESTLGHFSECHQSLDGIEVVVVENSPAEFRRDLALPGRLGARLIVCDEVGLSHARNAGIRQSTGSIVAFLDDDAYVCPDWAHRVCDVFSQKGIRTLGGRVIPRFTTQSLPDWYFPELSAYLSCIDWGHEDRFLRPGEWIVGANMAFSREIFQSFGVFDPSLGRKGEGNLLGNEEIALLGKIGIENIYYSPACSVEHLIHADRVRLEWFRKRVYWQAVSDLLANIRYQSIAAMDDEYRTLAASFPAGQRNLNMLNFRPRTPEDFRNQLRAIYLFTYLAGKGFDLSA